MKEYKLSLKQVRSGEAIVKANTLEEARQKFQDGKEEYFEDYSENYPVDWTVVDVEEIEEE